MIANPVIDIGGKEYHMNLVFGSDYKVVSTYIVRSDSSSSSILLCKIM